MSYSNEKKATIGQAAISMSHPVLNSVLANPNSSRTDIISLYLLVNLALTKEQCLRLCCYRKDQGNTISVALRRMEEKNIIEKSNVDSGDNKTTVYYLSNKATVETGKMFSSCLSDAIKNDEDIKTLYNSIISSEEITPSDCADYLVERCQKFNISKRQTNHFFGTKEIPFAFLSNVGYSSPYLFSCYHEVHFDDSGELVSIYRKILQGLKHQKGEVRSDSALTFHINPGHSETLNLYVEHDTGTQTSVVLKEKITQYVEHVFTPVLNKKNSIVPVLIFSISDNVTMKEIESAPRMEFKTRERYLARGLSAIAAVYMGLKDDIYGVTLYELKAILENSPLSVKDKETFLPFIDLCIEDIGGDKNAIDVVDKLYSNSKTGNEDKYTAYKKMCERYYNNRRNLLYGIMDAMPELQNLFLKGLSVCAFSVHKNIAVRTLLPECCRMSSVLVKSFSSAATPLRVTSLRPLSSFPLEDGEIVLRNVYTLSDGRKVAVENIGDDYGAFYRIQHLLDVDDAPCEILCIFSNYDTDKIKKMFLPYRYNESFSHFYVMSYMVKEEEISGDRDRTFSFSNVVFPGAISANDFV